jgi:uncharacterized Zn-finger protein
MFYFYFARSSLAPQFACKYCSTAFPGNDELLLHIRNCHSVERPFQCSECLKSFPRAYDLRRHGGVHERQRAGTVPLVGGIETKAVENLELETSEDSSRFLLSL